MNIWIVGGSSGIGLELVTLWLDAGHHVVVSARHAEGSDALKMLAALHDDRLICIDLDVTTSQGVNAVCNRAVAAFGGLDLWFYNAGAYHPMTCDEWDIETFEQQAQVNYLGAVRLMKHLLPHFEKQPGGRWVWNASLASVFGLPYGGGYSAPKAALVNLAESLQPELARKGIRLHIINHGFVRTRLTDKNAFKMPELMEPGAAAENIIAALEHDRFESHFPFKLAAFLRLLRIVPYAAALAITKKTLR